MDATAKYDAYSVIADYAERERVSRLARRMAELRDAPKKMVAYRDISMQEGIPEKTLQRLFTKWRASGENDLVLADKRKLVKATPGSKFYHDFVRYCEKDMNTDQGGYDAMMRDFYAGESFSFGTWRDVFREQFPASPVPANCPLSWIPKGMTYANLMRMRKNDPNRQISQAWNRGGQFAALGNTLPVIRSRVGLPVGSLFQADDVWHNIDVFAPGQTGTFQPLEFAIYDVSSAFKVVSAMKPRVIVTDPKTGKEVRDNLKEVQFRFAMQYLVCCKGFHKDGATFILERGTTAIRENVQRRIAAVPGFGKLLKFQVSGILNQPAHQGLLMGNAGGNPRMKSLCECAHNIIHNATASLLGNRGRDAAHMHESNAAVVKYAASEIELAQKIDPMLIPHLMLPILPYDKYCQYFYMIQDEVMDRTRHNLEGWAGREVMEYRLDAHSDSWLNCSRFNDMSPDQLCATVAVINSDKEHLLRQRKMSRREVWMAGQRDLIRWPLFDLPAFADPRDTKEATVRPDGTIAFTDIVYYPGQRKTYIAEVVDRNGIHRRLSPGTKVRFYWNPLGELANYIWIADDADNILGMCPILKTAAWSSPDTIKAALGQKMHQITEQMAEVQARHLPETVNRIASEKFNKILLDSAKEAARLPTIHGDALPASEVLQISAEESVEATEQTTEAFNPTQFLKTLV